MVAGDEQADEISNRFNVGLKPMKLLIFFAGDGAAEAGSHWIDEYQIGSVEQAELIINQSIGWRQQTAVLLQHNAPWPQNAKMKPDRRGSRPAIECEGDRAAIFERFSISLIRRIYCISYEENGRLGLFTFFFIFRLEYDAAGCRRVMECFAANRD